MERKLEDYDKMIETMSWRYVHSFRNRKELKDLIQEGREEFLLLRQSEKSKPLTCSFHTALSTKIKQRWLNELKQFREYKKHGAGVTIISLNSDFDTHKEERKEWEEEDGGTSLSSINRSRLQSFAVLSFDPEEKLNSWIDVSEEMKVLCQLLLDSPKELVILSKSFGIQDSVAKYLKKFKGWKPQRIKKLRAEMSLAIWG